MAECFHCHNLAKRKLAHELLGSLAERLPLLRAINAVKPDPFTRVPCMTEMVSPSKIPTTRPVSGQHKRRE
jgi:hypothetical protein